MKLSETNFKIASALLVLTFATVLCYVNTWWNSFVYDDHVYIEQNPQVTGPIDLPKIFTSSYPPSTPDQGLYRPMLTLSYNFVSKIWGIPQKPDAFNGFLFTNTIMHLLCVVLAFFLFLRLRFKIGVSFCAALLFAIHPILSESVAWAVGRAEIGAALWTLIALHLFWTPRGWIRFLALPAWLVALLFKESAIMAPALAAVLAFYRPETFPKLRGRGGLAFGAAALVCLGAYAGLRALALPNLVPSVTPFLGIKTAFGQFSTAVVMLGKYLIYVFLPMPLSVFHDIAPAMNLLDLRFLITLAGFGILCWSLWKWRNQTRDWRYGILWWIVALFPASNLLVPIGTIFGERFLYLPCLFLYVALAQTVSQWMAKPVSDASPGKRGRTRLLIQSWARASVPVMVVIAILYVLIFIKTVRRNSDWHNDLTLWASVMEHYPNSFQAAAPYATALSRASRYEEAMDYLKKSEAGIAGRPEVYRKIFSPKLQQLRSEIVYGLDRKKYFSEMEAGRKLVLEGQPKGALDVFEKLANKYPQFSEGEESIGDIYFKLGNPLGAAQHYKKAILISPDRAMLFGKLAQSLVQLGARDHAIEMYERSLILDERDPIANYNIAVLWNDIGQTDKSIYYLERAVSFYPPFTAARLNLASLYKTKGRNEDAIHQLQQVLIKEPQNPEAQKMLRKITKKELETESGKEQKS